MVKYFVRIKIQPIFRKKWPQKGVNRISDLIRDNELFKLSKRNINIHTIFLEY